MKKQSKCIYGFSLVEITISLLVIAVGILAVFGLMGDALRANTKTLDDTIAATFAESVFSSIFAAKWDVVINDETNNCIKGDVSILMGESFWNQESDEESIPINVTNCFANSIKFRYQPVNTNQTIEYYPLSYAIKIEKQKDALGYSGGDMGEKEDCKSKDGRYPVWDHVISPKTNAVWRSFRLRVWIGEFADTSDKSDPYEFYTEQYKFIDPSEEYGQQGGTGN